MLPVKRTRHGRDGIGSPAPTFDGLDKAHALPRLLGGGTGIPDLADITAWTDAMLLPTQGCPSDDDGTGRQ
jgi:hypothetical protein